MMMTGADVGEILAWVVVLGFVVLFLGLMASER